MGNSASYEQQVNSYTGNLNTQHTDLDLSMKRIEAEADRVIGIILMRHYNDREALCKQIAYHKVDELSQFFPTEVINNVRYKLGVNANVTNATMERNRQNVCRDIVNFYLKKINLITNIQKEVPNCLNMEQEIYRNLTQKLESNRLNNQDSLAVYEKLEKFNKDIKKRYDLIEREIERIRLAKNMTELDAIARTTNTILSDTNKICKIHENELFQYSDRAGQFQEKRNVEVASDIRRETQRQESFLASYAIPPTENMVERNLQPQLQQTMIPPMSPVLSPRTYVAPPIPLSPQRTIVQTSPQIMRSVIFPLPPIRTVVQPTIMQPTIMQPTIMQPTIMQPTIMQQREVRDVIQEYPVHERIVRRPVTVSHEFIDEKPAVAVPPSTPIVVTPVPVVAPVVAPVVPPVVAPVEQSIPVAQFPERSNTAVVTKTTVAPQKQITVRADSVRRVGNTIHVKNPSKVEVTRIIPKERVEVSRVIEPRTVRVERTVIPKKTSVVAVNTSEPIRGVPVKALKNFVAQSPSELTVRAGQPLTYLGSSAQNWSKVRTHQGVEGYIPHNIIGQ
jgi:hypothetical protein